MTLLLDKVPLWVRPVLGLALVVIGSILALHSSASIKIFVILVACGLITVGVSRIIGAFGKEPDEEQVLPRIVGLSGALLIIAGIAALLWRGATLPMLALTVSSALLITGAVSFCSIFSKASKHKTSSALSGLASIISGLLVLLWPTLSLWAFGVFFGGWLIFSGLRLVLGFFSKNQDQIQPKEPGKFRSFSKLAGSALALVLAIGMVLITSFIHAGDPRLVPDAFYTPPATVPAEPGKLLRFDELHEGISQDAEAWRILYTTTNADGSPAVASGSVVVPKVRGTDPLPVISIAHGTKGIIPRCAPTLSPRPLADGPAAALRGLVSEGWAGVTSDYVGLGTEGPHPYLVGQAEGRNVLDAYRAATELEGFILRDDTVL